jgi:hypothetical protein
MYFKLSNTLTVHKTPSKFARYEFNLRFKPGIGVDMNLELGWNSVFSNLEFSPEFIQKNV